MLNSHKICLLVVDDEPDLREVIILVLASCIKADFIEAGSGKEAIGLIETKESEIDLIISDFNMPNGNGGSLSKYLHEKGISVPFVLLSSDERKKHEELLKVPGRSYLQKPFNNEELRKILLSIIEKLDNSVVAEQEYIPVSLSTLLRLSEIKRPLYLQMNEKKYVKVLNAGTPFSYEEVDRFTSKNISHLYVHKDDMGPLLNEFRENVFTEMYFQSLKEKSTEALKISKSTVELIQLAAKSLHWSEEIISMGNDNVRMIQNVVSSVNDIGNVFDWFETDQHDLGVSTGVMLSYFLVALAKELGMTNQRQVEVLTMASFFHDMMLNEYQIRNQEQFIKGMNLGININKNDLEKIKNHPLEARSVLMNWDQCPVDLLDIVEQHHELPDGSGFPKGLRSDQLHSLSGIFIVVCHAMEVFIKSREKRAVVDYLKSKESLFTSPSTVNAYKASIKLFSA